MPRWHADVPLHARNRTVGQLRLTGAAKEGSVFAWMGELIEGLRPVETYINDLLEGNNPGPILAFGNERSNSPLSDGDVDATDDAILTNAPTSGPGSEQDQISC